MPGMNIPRVVSFGGGVQSTALLVLAAQNRIDFRTFLFANVGTDSEHPATLRYIEEHARPYATKHHLELMELHRKRNGKPDTLRDGIRRGVSIPARRSKDGPPMIRSCTRDYKIKVVAAEIRRRGGSKTNPGIVALGISTDEIERARTIGVDPRNPIQSITYPLLDLGLRRTDCKSIIATAGLPIPPASSCYFCPFHDREAWRKLKRETPHLFAQATTLEAEISTPERPVYLTRTGVPLDRAIDDQLTLDGIDDCDSGYCFT